MGVCQFNALVMESEPAIRIDNKRFFVNTVAVFPRVAVEKDIPGNGSAIDTDKEMKTEKSGVGVFGPAVRSTQYGAWSD